GIRDKLVTGVQTCALPICRKTSLAGSISKYWSIGIHDLLSTRILARASQVLSETCLHPNHRICWEPATFTSQLTRSLRIPGIAEIGRASCRERVKITEVGV